MTFFVVRRVLGEDEKEKAHVTPFTHSFEAAAVEAKEARASAAAREEMHVLAIYHTAGREKLSATF